MREQGKTVVIVTHKLSEVLAISDQVTVMRDGRVVGHRPTAGTSAVELARLMVGRDVLLRVVKPPAKPGAAVLAVRDLSLFSKKTRKANAAGSGVSTASPSRFAPARSSASRRSRGTARPS